MTDPIILALILLGSLVLPVGGVCLARGRVPLGSVLLCVPAAVLLATTVEALGQPKPMAYDLACRPTADTARVVRGEPREGDGTILLWLVIPGCGDRFYAIPYTRRDAQQLQDARKGAKGDGKGEGRPITMRLGKPGEKNLDPDRAPRFYAEPQPAPPPKDGET